jgi:hypothetical protein
MSTGAVEMLMISFKVQSEIDESSPYVQTIPLLRRDPIQSPCDHSLLPLNDQD